MLFLTVSLVLFEGGVPAQSAASVQRHHTIDAIYMTVPKNESGRSWFDPEHEAGHD